MPLVAHRIIETNRHLGQETSMSCQAKIVIIKMDKGNLLYQIKVGSAL